MRYLLLSDIHANKTAFDRVLKHASQHAWDKVIFLGDVVGYGHEPEACVQQLMELKPYVAIKGNHEVMLQDVINKTPGSRYAMPETAAHATQLSDESIAFLMNLKDQHLDNSWAAIHAALRERWEYIISVPVARGNAALMQRPLYFVGHTHVASAYINTPANSNTWQARLFKDACTTLELPADFRAFINPGSVGQPRDGVPLASYGIFDEAVMRTEFFRV